MWIDQNFPNGHARKLHIYGKSSEVEAAVAEVEYLIKSAPINNARRVIPTSEVRHERCGRSKSCYTAWCRCRMNLER